jgi:hypothetical protein
VRGIVLAVVLSACPAAPPRADAPPLLPNAAPSPAPGQGSAASEAGADALLRQPLARFRTDEGCARAHRPTGDLLVDLAAISRLCAGGLVALLPDAGVLLLPPDADKEIAFSVDPETCLRAVAVAERPGVDLWIAQGARLLSGSSSASKVVAVGPDGPVCVREGGPTRLGVRVRGEGSASVAVQLWRSTQGDGGGL